MYRLRQTFRVYFLALVAILAACQSTVVAPTPAPTAALPTASSATDSASALPPTRDLSTPTALPTSTPEPATVTPVAPTRAAASPTPVIGPVLTVDQPQAGQRFTLGMPITVTGFAQVTPGMSIRVGLTSATGWSLAEAEAAVDGTAWQATLPSPQQVTGRANLQAVILDEGGVELARSSVAIEMTADRAHSSSFVRLFRPTADMVAVAGHNLFLDGHLWRAGGGQLQAAVFMNDCQESVADVSFQLTTSSTWQAFVVLPRDVSGPACAVAWVGQPGAEDWRAAQVPITVLSQDDPAAEGLVIANPRTDQVVSAGESFLFNGVAYNVPGQTVTIDVVLENGQVIGEAEAEADYFGYWRAELNIPAGVEGVAVVTAFLGDEAEPVAVTEVPFEIVPSGP